MKKVLIIPHHPDMSNIKIRLTEIATAISENYNIYLVNWKAAEGEYSLLKRIYWALRDLFTKTKLYKQNALSIVKVRSFGSTLAPPHKEGRASTVSEATPVCAEIVLNSVEDCPTGIHPLGRRKARKKPVSPGMPGALTAVKFPILHRPWCIAPIFNYFWLESIINKEKIDVVINGSYYMFNIPQKRSFKYIYDIADLPETFNRSISMQIDREIKKADKVTTASRGLAKYIFNKFNRSALFIPNGTDLEKMRSVKEEDVDRIRRRYNLGGKWVIGYIGNIGPWVNVELAVESFYKIESQFSDAVLIWIGVSRYIKDLKKKYEKENIIFTGGIEKQNIESYFKVIDLGILPKRKCLFQDLAFHIKGIEYTAAGKFVVSTPLEEITSLNFPNFIFAQEEVNEWVGAIKKARFSKWDRHWDNLADEYDWDRICRKTAEIIEGKDENSY